MLSSIELKRRPSETELGYIKRIGEMKTAGLLDMTWAELADVFNNELRDDGQKYSESTYRKKFAAMQQFRDEFDSNVSEDAEDINNIRRELEKERVKVRDERNEYRRLLREEARKESYREQFIRSIEEAAGKHPLEYDDNKVRDIPHSDNDILISLTDIHAGLEINNYWNAYDGDILKFRMNHYLDRIFEIKHRHHSENVYLVIQESINGLIHVTNRIENNQDIIDQFLMVTDYICDFISKLSDWFKNVYVYVAPGNHGRIVAKKDQSLANENFDNLLSPFIKAKMQLYPNVFCRENTIDQGIAVFGVRGLTVVSTHGDLDPIDKVADNMRNMLKTNIDLILVGHRHTNRLYTECDVKVVQSGCLSGTDSYAVSIRKNNRPEQAVCVISEREGLDCIYDVKF